MPNFLEQLIAEWYEYQGFFIRRNVRVGKRPEGGFEGELDVVAFHPVEKHLVHVEASSDANSWANRESQFLKKFDIGRKYIPELFKGFEPLPEIESIALLSEGSSRNHAAIGGGKVMMVGELMSEIKKKIPNSLIAQVPEKYIILRTLQFARDCWIS
jgi:hypothetical protein